MGLGSLAYYAAMRRPPWERECVCMATAIGRMTIGGTWAWLVQAREVPEFISEAHYNQWRMAVDLANDQWVAQFGGADQTRRVELEDVPQWVLDEMHRIARAR